MYPNRPIAWLQNWSHWLQTFWNLRKKNFWSHGAKFLVHFFHFFIKNFGAKKKNCQINIGAKKIKKNEKNHFFWIFSKEFLNFQKKKWIFSEKISKSLEPKKIFFLILKNWSQLFFWKKVQNFGAKSLEPKVWPLILDKIKKFH